MRGVARPSWRSNDEQRALVEAVNEAIAHAERVSREAEDLVWEAARKARASGIPDTQLCNATGLNRATMNRRLGPREDGKQRGDTTSSTP